MHWRIQKKPNHLMYMDDIKLFAENEKELETLIQAVIIYSEDVGIEFGIKKCTMLIMRSGKRYMMEGIELSSKEKIRMFGKKEAYKYLGVLEADTIKQVEIKEKFIKEYLRRTRKLYEIKLYSRNLIKVINAKLSPSWSGRGKNLNKWTKEQVNSLRTWHYIPGLM